MDRSDSEPGSEADDVTEPQDLFNDEADEDRVGDKEDEAEEVPVKPKKEFKTEDKPKSKRAGGSRVVLNFQTLAKPSGLPALKKLFENFKFKGNGHEEEDLTRIMGILQQWMCYQLCPSYDFESCMLQLEALGKKRIVQTLMKKYRLGIEDWGERIPEDKDKNNTDGETEACEPYQENNLDFLLNEEVADADSEEELRPTTGEMEAEQSTQKETEVTLTPEQLERIARNRKLAEERRMKRMSQQESTANNESTSINDSEIEPMEVDNT